MTEHVNWLILTPISAECNDPGPEGFLDYHQCLAANRDQLLLFFGMLEKAKAEEIVGFVETERGLDVQHAYIQKIIWESPMEDLLDWIFTNVQFKA
jgi:hypothetical protein